MKELSSDDIQAQLGRHVLSHIRRAGGLMVFFAEQHVQACHHGQDSAQ
jgi:hypothetical protein